MAPFTFPTEGVEFAELLRRNEANTDLKPVPLVSEAPPNAAYPSVAIFSCCDFRFNAEELFQIKKGEAFLFSTIGGNVKPILGDLLFLDTYLGSILKEIIIIHHEGVSVSTLMVAKAVWLTIEDCGTTKVTPQMIRDHTKEIANNPALEKEIDALEFDMHNGQSLEESVRRDLQFLKDSPYLRKDLAANARGFIFYLSKNKLVEVKL